MTNLKELKLLIEKNKGKINFKSVEVRKGYIVFKNREKKIDGRSIKKLIAFVNFLNERYKGLNVPILLDLGNIEFVDKLTYIFFEIICYLLIKEYRHIVVINAEYKSSIWIEGIESSPLLILNDGTRQNMEKYVRKFHDDLYKNHYRRVIKNNEDSVELSKKMDEIAYFLKFSGVQDNCIDVISEVVVELIGNAWEHASAECLVDLDVTNSYFKRESTKSFMGVNLAVINFSPDLLGDSIREKILDNNNNLPKRYASVKEAYNNHKNIFDLLYKEEDFFNIASFQHKISGRKNNVATGGTGLTKLISSLEKRSDAHRCYLVTGNRVLWFLHEYLEYTLDGWIGFNENNDFFHTRPTSKVLGNNAIYMPGTAYNLNFVMKRREDYE